MLEGKTEEDLREAAMGTVMRQPNEKKAECILYFKKYLEDVDFICVNENIGHDIIAPIKNQFKICKGEMSSMFFADKIRVLNLDFVLGVKNKFTYEYDIFLDAQIVSYMDRYAKGTLERSLHGIVKPLLIKREIMSYLNFMPYIMENCLVKGNFNDLELENLYNTLYLLNLPLTSKDRARKEALKQCEEIEEKFFTYDLHKQKERYDYVYCMLLKIVILHFKKATHKEKLEELIDFENHVTYTCDIAFINIAYEFWEQGTSLSFFGRVQKGRQDLLKILKNMAWDIYHLFQACLEFSYFQKEKADVMMPLFYTVDKRLIELSKIAKIEGAIVDKKRRLSFPVYKMDIINKYFCYSEQKKYFGIEELHNRNQHRSRCVDTKMIGLELEQELMKIV